MSLFRFGVKSKAEGVLVCSWRVPRCLLLAVDLDFVSDKVVGGGADIEEDKVYRLTRSSGEPVARMRFEDCEFVDGGERATQRSGAVCAVNRNESENVVVRATSCSIASSVGMSAAGGVVVFRGRGEREVTGIEAMKP